jgi:hypothetical protein
MRSRIPRYVKTGFEGLDIMRDGGGRDVDKRGKMYIKKERAIENGVGLVMPGNR